MASKNKPEAKIPAYNRKPLGKALPPVKIVQIPTAEELDLIVSLWDTYAPAQYRGMMDAEDRLVLQQTGEKPSGRFTWNAATMTYTNVETGHVVDQDEALSAVAAFVRAYSKA
jgi:hypothetical protein